jgi:tetratricopeptide (TPR) repeat protein
LPAYEKVVNRGPSQYYASACKKAAVIAYNHTQDFKKATEYYSRWAKVAQSEEDRLEAQLGGLEAAYRSKNDQAVKTLSNDVFENTNASNDEKASAMFYRGKLAFDKEQWDQALNSFNEVSRLSDNEETAEARYLIARIYYLQNELELAETLSREAYKESSSYPYWVAQSLILLSDILVEKEDLFNAKAALEAVLENFGESEEIQKIANEKLEKIKALEDE